MTGAGGGLAARLFGPGAAPALAPLLRRRAGTLFLLLGLGLVAAAAALAPPWLTKLVIDDGLIARDPAALLLWSLALLGVGFAGLALGALNSVLHMKASMEMLAELRAGLAAAVLERSPRWRAERQTGELMARIDGDAGEAQQFAFNALLTGASSALRLVGGAAMLFVLEWRLALVAVALAPAELAFTAWARPRSEAFARETRERRGAFAGRVAEMLAGLFAIQAARGEGPVAAALAADQRDLNAALLRAHLFGEATRAAPATLAALVRSAVFLLGGLLVIRGEWPLGSLIAFLAYLGFLIGPAQSLIGLWHAQARAKAALERLAELWAPDERLVWPSRPAPLPPGGGALRFEAVDAPAGAGLALRLVSFDIPAGAKVRLAGASGAGKSSLLALLQRHADPVSGRVTLDGADLRTLSRDDLRGAVAFAPQRPFLIRGTAAENLRLSNPEAPEAALREALALVGLSDRLSPEDRIGEDGLTLSGGERQRLCLARTLLRPFRVLALDEALSEVDPETAARIMVEVDARFGAATRIVATHGGEAALGPFDFEIDVTQWRA